METLLNPTNPTWQNPTTFAITTPLLSESSNNSTSTTTTSTTSDDIDKDIENDNSLTFQRFQHDPISYNQIPSKPLSGCQFSSHKSLAVLTGHVDSVTCIALCGEFILSASQGKDIVVWQHPDLKQFTKFGYGDGSVKALVTVGNKVFSAHQDRKIRVWKVSRRSENVFKLTDTLPTTKDYLGKFMKQSNYVQTRRHHKCLWIEHVDSISCLTVCKGMIYSGSWDKTLKVWRVSDLKCLESIKAHDDAINGVVASEGLVYSCSADGKIKIWSKTEEKQGKSISHSLNAILEGHKDVSMNSVIVSNDNDSDVSSTIVYGGGSDGFIMGWRENSERWELVCEKKAHQSAVLCMCLMGDFICSGSADKSICIWTRDAINGGLSKFGVMNGHEGPVKCLQASSYCVGGGFLLYSGSHDKSLRVWWVPKSNDTTSKNDSEKKLKSLCVRL